MNISHYLPSILKHDNICKLTKDYILIGNRKEYPFEKSYYKASTVDEAATAISDMVTQGGGPLEVALKSILFISRQDSFNRFELDRAIKLLSNARKTNTTMARELKSLRERIVPLFNLSQNDIACKVEEIIEERFNYYDNAYLNMAKNAQQFIFDGAKILTTCFAEHSFFLSLYLARESGKRIKVVTPETRPYLQGARLTAPSLLEMGYEHTLICDNMCASLMRNNDINLYMTASDLTIKDRSVVNKVGTLQNAICASYYKIPYYAFSLSFDESVKSRDEIIIEYRDKEEVKRVRSRYITEEGVNAIYPCFDIIDSSLVSGIIMPDGIY